MEASPARWRSLRVGDHIRITALPGEIWAPHGETRSLFDHLIANSVPVTVIRVDDDGYPWVEYSFQESDGLRVWEYLLIKHDDFELIGTD
jgi:hypothetical protein